MAVVPLLKISVPYTANNLFINKENHRRDGVLSSVRCRAGVLPDQWIDSVLRLV